MITYAVVATMLNSYSTGIGKNLSDNVRSGNLAIELMKPYDILNKLVSIDIGQKITSTIRETVPMLIIAYFFLHIHLPSTLSVFFLFLCSTFIGILIGAQLDIIIGVCAFWLKNTFGLRMMKGAVVTLFTGALIPISLFPDWLKTTCRYLPFQSMVYIPISIYLGNLNVMDAIQAILIQVLWLFIVVILIRLLWTFALRKVTIYGG
jgi:ABC-2 type transport system permease protein